MATLRTPQSTSTAIQQRTTVGAGFTGQFPNNGGPPLDSTLDLVNRGIYKFPQATNAGLIYWDANEPLICGQMHIWLGGSGDISLYLVNLDANKAIIAGERILVEEQTGVSFVALDEARFKTVLLPNQALQLVTTAVGGQSQIVQAVASLERTYVR